MLLSLSSNHWDLGIAKERIQEWMHKGVLAELDLFGTK
jgi:hypothetical protein